MGVILTEIACFSGHKFEETRVLVSKSAKLLFCDVSRSREVVVFSVTKIAEVRGNGIWGRWRTGSGSSQQPRLTKPTQKQIK